jgi:hypothetical protein
MGSDAFANRHPYCSRLEESAASTGTSTAGRVAAAFMASLDGEPLSARKVAADLALAR